MRITLTYNERLSDESPIGEFLTAEEVGVIATAIESLGHDLALLEASGPSDTFVEKLLGSRKAY